MDSFAHTNYLHVIKRRWGFVAVVTSIVLLLTIGISLLQPFEYESEVNILVIQKSAIGIDAYSASKSAERIGHNLSQIVYSSSFFSQVMNGGFDIDKTYFPQDENKRRKKWQKMISAEVPANTTILNIKVFHEKRDQAAVIAQAISEVLDKKAEEYVGVGDIDLKVVDAPLTSNFPVKPNVLLNGVLGLFLGFFIAVASLLISYSEDEAVHDVFQHGAVSLKETLEEHQEASPGEVEQEPRVFPRTPSVSFESEVIPPKPAVNETVSLEHKTEDVLENFDDISLGSFPAFSDDGTVQTLPKDDK